MLASSRLTQGKVGKPNSCAKIFTGGSRSHRGMYDRSFIQVCTRGVTSGRDCKSMIVSSYILAFSAAIHSTMQVMYPIPSTTIRHTICPPQRASPRLKTPQYLNDMQPPFSKPCASSMLHCLDFPHTSLAFNIPPVHEFSRKLRPATTVSSLSQVPESWPPEGFALRDRTRSPGAYPRNLACFVPRR